MDAAILRILKKLDRPPSGPNWVRFISDDPHKICKNIVAFALGQPRVNYQQGYRTIKDRIELRITPEDALRAVAERGAPASREPNQRLVSAFLSYDTERGYSSSNPIGFEPGFFRVSREITVPVSPLSIIREGGKFVPIFICGWTKNTLDLMQRRLLSTIYEDAFLSLTDFQESPSEILFFPKGDEAERIAEIWHRGDYDLLSDSQLQQHVDAFLEGRELARAVLTEKLTAAEADQDFENVKAEAPYAIKDLFDPNI